MTNGIMNFDIQWRLTSCLKTWIPVLLCTQVQLGASLAGPEHLRCSPYYYPHVDVI